MKIKTTLLLLFITTLVHSQTKCNIKNENHTVSYTNMTLFSKGEPVNNAASKATFVFVHSMNGVLQTINESGKIDSYYKTSLTTFEQTSDGDIIIGCNYMGKDGIPIYVVYFDDCSLGTVIMYPNNVYIKFYNSK